MLEKTYSGLGRTKTDAKMNAAANALEELNSSGSFASREQRVKSEWRASINNMQISALQQQDPKLAGQLVLILSQSADT